MATDHANTTTEKGAGLARGPAFVTGTTLSVLGLILFFEVGGTPLSTSGFPDAITAGQRVVGFDVNGWTAWLTTAAGVLLLIGAAQHLAAKGVSLAVGLVLGAASVIALIDGDDVLGLAAANGLTALVWGVAAAVLLANTLAPRITHERQLARDRSTAHDARGHSPVNDRGRDTERRGDATTPPVAPTGNDPRTTTEHQPSGPARRN